MMYRLALVAFVAFAVLGVSSVFYAHYIDIRDVEAVIMTRNVVDCITPEGVFNLSSVDGEILSYCGFSDDEVGRFYVRVNVSDEKGDVVEFSQGDSGAMWVKEIFDRGKAAVGIEKYEPGYSDRVYDVIILNDSVRSYGKIEVEVLVSDE